MPKFNKTYLQELKKKVKDIKERHKILGLSIYIGSFSAREQLGTQGYFTESRDITSKIEEAKFIAEQQGNTLALLESQTPNELISSLEKAICHVKDIEIPDSQLSNAMRNLDYETIGKRSETRLLGKGNNSTYLKNKDTRDLARIFLREEETIRHGLVYEKTNQ